MGANVRSLAARVYLPLKASFLCLEIISWTKSRRCKFRRRVCVMAEGNRPYETTLYTCLPTSGNMKEFIDRMSIADPLLSSCSLWPLQGVRPDADGDFIHAERPRPLLGGGDGGGGGGPRPRRLVPWRRNAYEGALRGCLALMRHFKDHMEIGDMFKNLLGKCSPEK